MVYRGVDVLAVNIHGKRVGAVSAANNRRGYAFQYDPVWVRRRIELSPLLMPLSQSRRIFTFVDLPSETFYLLPPMLADALPDHFGNSIINAVLAREGVDPRDVTPLDRLAYTGARAMGALTFEPDRTPNNLPSVVEMNEMVEAARFAVHGNLAESNTRTEALQNLLAVGTSAGGARAKAVVAWNRESGDLRAGGIAAPEGYEQWLLKFDGVGVDTQLGQSEQYGRIEYAYSLMARAAGIEMAETMLLEESGRAHFMTRRFDRPGKSGERVHMQTLCGIAALDYKLTGVHDYASYFTTMRAIGIDSAEELSQAYRRLVFNVLAANNDDHTKNFAFLMDADGSWSLAPAYDVTFAYNPANKWIARHLMSVEGEFHDITTDHLKNFADRLEIPGYKTVIGEVAHAVSAASKYLTDAGVTEEGQRPILERLEAIRSRA